MNLPTLDPAFFQVIDHPVVLPVLEHFLDTTMILGSLSSRIVRPGDGQQDFHGDIPENLLNLTSPVMMNTVWMRTSAPRSATRGSCPAFTRAVWPGLPKAWRSGTWCSPRPPPAACSSSCWHGGGTNTSDRDRYALFGHYRKSMLMFHACIAVSTRCTLPICIWRERLREQTAAAESRLCSSRRHARLTPAATGA